MSIIVNLQKIIIPDLEVPENVLNPLKILIKSSNNLIKNVIKHSFSNNNHLCIDRIKS